MQTEKKREGEELIDTDVVIVGGVEVEEGIGRINGDGKK